jgi:hypothetical protein
VSAGCAFLFFVCSERCGTTPRRHGEDKVCADI